MKDDHGRTRRPARAARAGRHEEGERRDPAPRGAARRVGSPDGPIGAIGAPSEDAIRMRAYELFQARGGAPGHALDDWIAAEQALHATAPPAPQLDGRSVERTV